MERAGDGDLGVIVTSNCKVGRQCAEAAKKGNRILGMINRTFSCKGSCKL